MILGSKDLNLIVGAGRSHEHLIHLRHHLITEWVFDLHHPDLGHLQTHLSLGDISSSSGVTRLEAPLRDQAPAWKNVSRNAYMALASVNALFFISRGS